MRWLKHILLIFAMACGMYYYLYSYKPRHYDIGWLIFNSVLNIGIWMLLISIPYVVIYLILFYVRKVIHKK